MKWFINVPFLSEPPAPLDWHSTGETLLSFGKKCPMYLLIWVIVIEKKCFIDMTYDTGHWFIASKWQHLYIYYFPIPDPFFTFPWVFRKSYLTNFLIQILLIYADPQSKPSTFYAGPYSAWSKFCTRWRILVDSEFSWNSSWHFLMVITNSANTG